MPDHAHSILPDLDSADYSEALRRKLYDAAVQIIFSDGSPLPEYSPDRCELVVFYAWGRWFAVWRDWESEDTAEGMLPMSRLWQVVRLQNDTRSPLGIILHEV